MSYCHGSKQERTQRTVRNGEKSQPHRTQFSRQRSRTAQTAETG